MIKWNNSGFSLFETIIAIGILATGLALMSQTWGSSVQRVAKIEKAFEVSLLMERKMSELEMQYRDINMEHIPDETSEEDFGSDYPGYSWKMNSRKMELPDLTATLTSQEGGADQMSLMIMRQLTEHFSKSIREMKLTIIYKPPTSKKKMEYSVTTYLVDFQRDIPIPNLGGM
jgi:general secretion pathway protein I